MLLTWYLLKMVKRATIVMIAGKLALKLHCFKLIKKMMYRQIL
jgi:hypothetical protein